MSELTGQKSLQFSYVFIFLGWNNKLLGLKLQNQEKGSATLPWNKVNEAE